MSSSWSPSESTRCQQNPLRISSLILFRRFALTPATCISECLSPLALLALRYQKGGTLLDFCVKNKVDECLALYLFSQLISALDHCHAKVCLCAGWPV